MAVDDQYTVSLLHFDGNLTDESGKMWTAYGGAATSTAQKKFGSGALYGVDTDSCYVETLDNLDFELGSSFSVDFWYYLSGPSSYIRCDQYYTGGYFFTQFLASPTTTQAAYSNGTNWVKNNSFSQTISLNQLHHYAACKTENQLLLFHDGVLCQSISDTTSWPNCIGNLKIHLRNVYIDEFRISKGIARWTANFTPPNAPYGANPIFAQVF